jgi:hypothetical protein
MNKILVASLIVSVVLLAGCESKNGQIPDTKTSVKGDISTDICAEFSADFIYSVIKKPIVRVEPSKISGVFSCDYYTDYKEDFYKDAKYNYVGAGGPSITIVLDNLNVEKQKEARKYLGMTVESSPKIAMENMITYRENKSIWSADLIINPNRFVWANYSHKAITDDQLIDLVAAMADKINGRLKIKIEKNPIDLEAAKAAELGVSQEQVVRDFLNALASKDIPKALGMMDANENTKQGWGVNFNTIKSLEIKKIEEAFKEEWTPNKQTFKATLKVSVTEQGLQIGWENGDNFRWITVEKNNNVWQIHELANNP